MANMLIQCKTVFLKIQTMCGVMVCGCANSSCHGNGSQCLYLQQQAVQEEFFGPKNEDTISL
jgi:hypothetical protein